MAGPTPAPGLGGLASRVIDEYQLRRIAVVTSHTTGNPALGTLDLSATELALVVQTPAPVPGMPTGPTSLALAEFQPWHGRVDLVILDPFHTYDASVDGILSAASLVRPGGLLLVHDCLPPPELISPEFMPGSWCGVTFAAFRDLCAGNGLAWFTVSNDFGIGAARVPAGGITAVPVDDAWTADNHPEYLRRYLDDPYAMMRAVAAHDAMSAIDALMRDQSVDPLLQTFAGWDPALVDIFDSADRTAAGWRDTAHENEQLRQEAQRLADLDAEQRRDTAREMEQLRQQVQHLTGLNADQQAMLIETSRPTWQARAMVKSVPRAVRRRLRR